MELREIKEFLKSKKGYLKEGGKRLRNHLRNKGFETTIKNCKEALRQCRAEEKGYPTPICESKEATDLNYDAAIHYMVENIDRMAIFAGTHNELSSYKLMEYMQELNIEKKDVRIWFGQLYGMSDNISYNLSANGYNNAKYLPFGPVRDVMPYLIRRAEENTSVAGQTSRELKLITAERDRRKGK